MIEIMKKTAVAAVESTNPVIVLFGTVMNLTPLEVLIDQKITLVKRQIICTERKISAMEEGHRLVLLRMQGGQRYYVAENLDEGTGGGDGEDGEDGDE